MYTLKIYKAEDMVEQQTTETAEGLMNLIDLANRVYYGDHYEIWRDDVLVDRGLLDFPKEE